MYELRKDIIYSVIIHIFILIFISKFQFTSKRLRFYEVSLEVETKDVSIPRIAKRRFRIKQRERILIKGDEPVYFKPELREEEIDKKPEFFEEEEEEIYTEEIEDITPEIPERKRIEFGKKELSGPVSTRVILRKVYPVYPDIARVNGWEGEVELKFWVNEDGIVESVQILKTSGYPVLDDAAMNAIKKWLFSPFKSKQWGKITFRFKLK